MTNIKNKRNYIDNDIDDDILILVSIHTGEVENKITKGTKKHAPNYVFVIIKFYRILKSILNKYTLVSSPPVLCSFVNILE